jgi:hypothetical protein
MKYKVPLLVGLAAVAFTTTLTGCHRRTIRTAEDITPGNYPCTKMDWRYGAADIRIQTSKVASQIMDRWYAKTMYDCKNGKPRVVITEIDNCTDMYISTDMIRDIFEGVAIDDGRFTVTVGNACDERELDMLMQKITHDPKYSNCSRLTPGQATAPQFLGKVRITKAVTSDNFFDYEDYRMTITLYDIETQEAIESSWDVLTKRVQRCR